MPTCWRHRLGPACPRCRRVWAPLWPRPRPLWSRSRQPRCRRAEKYDRNPMGHRRKLEGGRGGPGPTPCARPGLHHGQHELHEHKRGHQIQLARTCPRRHGAAAIIFGGGAERYAVLVVDIACKSRIGERSYALADRPAAEPCARVSPCKSRQQGLRVALLPLARSIPRASAFPGADPAGTLSGHQIHDE